MKLHIHNSFITELPADKDQNNIPRQVEKACFSYVQPVVPSKPVLIHAVAEVADIIGLSQTDLDSPEFLKVFSGSTVYSGTKPYAMCYAGHQFGNWAGQLGDGRAINLTEVINNDQLYTLQLKGAGPTPYSRNADGFAVLRSSIREYLCAEAMHHLGVPTTRSLSLMETGDPVLRDVLYNGNPAYEKGAVVCRVAPSFIRFGSFEIFAARNDLENLRLLTDYTIKHHFSDIKEEGVSKYVALFSAVAKATRTMIIHWQRVGFVHGVMNTDNMSIHGITIDYGPYGWLEDYNSGWTPNTTDAQYKRYRFGNQAEIALWNLYQLANALFLLIEEAAPLEAVLESFQSNYEKDYLQMMQDKLGLTGDAENDLILIGTLVQLLEKAETDMTLFFRMLSKITKDNAGEAAFETIRIAFYNEAQLPQNVRSEWEQWLQNYLNRLQKETISDEERTNKMNACNPKYVLRNYMAQLAIDAAEKGDYSIVIELFNVLQKPYEEQPEFEKWFAKRPDWAREKVGCSMLSCSS
ncbi:protein adenylyltransferase SelO [Flavobacterium turcicum]|uniref:Protein nucleotidyltransferase YdiU n=1 Tax=Flavobacterium turcicum TaxID=2764718 RepID=A0ABR7JF51_9FLAO|nr:YdiU family protein [Flavobacterium turcicum]MBC5863131.1 YdiU family protein [Flavobacterium turcicum]NHL01862.1 YdiU family protein [Flavobacterium turcicum]